MMMAILILNFRYLCLCKFLHYDSILFVLDFLNLLSFNVRLQVTPFHIRRNLYVAELKVLHLKQKYIQECFFLFQKQLLLEIFLGVSVIFFAELGGRPHRMRDATQIQMRCAQDGISISDNWHIHTEATRHTQCNIICME